jgi:hypothetical protein
LPSGGWRLLLAGRRRLLLLPVLQEPGLTSWFIIVDS